MFMPALKSLFMVLFVFLLADSGMTDEGKGVGFHNESKLTWTSIITDVVKFRTKYEGKKEYKGKPKIQLPKPDFRGITVEDAIKKRRSVRNYSGSPMNSAEISQLLFSAQGITGQIYGEKLRTAPSAGALYPIELYVFINNVRGIEKGLYHYNLFEHSLTEIKKGDFRKEMLRAGLDQEMFRDANIVIAMTAIHKRITWKYGDRGFRYIYMEAGHIAQNILIQSVSLGLGSVVVGAFLDDELNRLLGIDGKEEISLYLVATGKV